MAEENTNKVDNALNEMGDEKQDDILQHFGQFRDYLGDQVQKGEKLGLGEDGLAKGAKRVGDYLENNKEPKNREEKLLQELWKVAEEDEKKTLGRLLVRFTDETNK